MAFIPHKWHKGAEPWEVKPAGALALTHAVGDAFILSASGLEPAGGSSPQYICMQTKSFESGGMIHVERVRPETIYETELEADFEPKIGGRYAISDNKLTSSTSSGVAEVVDFDGTAAGSKVRVRFPG